MCPNAKEQAMEENKRRYYAAYDERYKTAHRKGVTWMGESCTPIVMETIRKYSIRHDQKLMEIGCGEGRDVKTVFENGFDPIAIDISEEAISYCRKTMPEHADNFRVLDCLSESMGERFDFIWSVAVIHMLVPDEDRKRFYVFLRGHLKSEGLALICSMGNGEREMQTDIDKAFELQEREHESGRMTVAATSCRMVSFKTFERELNDAGLTILEKSITEAYPEFDSLMYAVVKAEETV